jgi:hypothetical protein
MTSEARLRRGETWVLTFTIVYFVAFTASFVTRGDYEFFAYSVTMAVLIVFIANALRFITLPLTMLWALSFWGLAHKAGGGIPVGDGVLYSVTVLPIAGSGELAILKYDQVVHVIGSVVVTWVLWHVMASFYTAMRRTWAIYVYSAMAAMGLGAIHELVEFTAVLTFPETNVGGYYNTVLDIAFNALCALVAITLIARAESRR